MVRARYSFQLTPSCSHSYHVARNGMYHIMTGATRSLTFTLTACTNHLQYQICSRLDRLTASVNGRPYLRCLWKRLELDAGSSSPRAALLALVGCPTRSVSEMNHCPLPCKAEAVGTGRRQTTPTRTALQSIFRIVSYHIVSNRIVASSLCI